MRHHTIPLAALLATATLPPLAAQGRAAPLVAAARAQVSANQLDSADVLLHLALDSATSSGDSANVLVWRAIVSFLHGDESGTSTAFHQALVLDSAINVQGLASMSPRLESLYEEERVNLAGNQVVYPSGQVDENPRRLSGPPVRYPLDLVRRQIRGRALVGLTIDTMGRAVPATIQFLSIPDSGYADPVRQMLLASSFSPGRVRGRAVQTMIELAIDLSPGTPPDATALVGAARTELAAHHADSALALLHLALATETHPSDGERVYALLVEGVAWSATGRDSAARADFDTALVGYRRLEARGVELAPFLRRLADSVGSARSPVPAADALGRPVVVGSVDVAPALLQHPPIVYPPEMQALRVGGTVTVEATVDASGRVVAGSAKVVQSPNPGLDREAVRVVVGSRYRPARRGGHAVSSVIRQAITFKPY